MEIKNYEDILKLPTWFAAQVTKGLDARLEKVSTPEQLIAASGGARPPARSGKSKKTVRAKKHK
jgi:hypothetical protein